MQSQTLTQLHQLKLGGMAAALQTQLEQVGTYEGEEELDQQIRDEQLRIAKAVQSKRLAEQTYYQCILDNLKNTNSKESIELLKQTCRNIAKTMEYAKKKPSDLSDEELCLSLGYEFDKSELKCK